MHGNIPVLSNGTATSDAAAEKIRPHAARLRSRVYALIHESGAHGMTADEVLARLEQETPGIGHASISQRPGELRDLELIYDSGERRPTRRGNPATVWRANPFKTI